MDYAVKGEYRRQILEEALDVRIREVTEYQVNIDNFDAAIALIGDDPDLQDFKRQLEGLVVSSRLEQKKAGIMLSVIRAQLGGEDVG